MVCVTFWNPNLMVCSNYRDFHNSFCTQLWNLGSYATKINTVFFFPYKSVIDRGKVPIVVGGTSFYIQFLLRGHTGAPPSTAESRAAVDELLEEYGGDWQAR